MLSCAVDPEEGDLPCRVPLATRWKAGNSARQGLHHDAHLLMTTGVPFRRGEPLVEGRDARPQRCGGLRVQAGQRRRGPASRALAAQVERRRGSPLRRPCSRPPGTARPPETAVRMATPRSRGRARFTPHTVADSILGDGLLRAFCFNRGTRGARSSRPSGRHPQTGPRIFGPRVAGPLTGRARLPQPLSSTEPAWLIPRQWPSRPRPFPSPTTRSSGPRVHPRAFRARRGGRRGRARARLGRGGTRSTPRWPSSRPGAKVPSIEWRRTLLAAARPRARCSARTSRTLVDGTVLVRPPGRRAVGHADRAAGRGAATAPRNGRRADGRRRRAVASAGIPTRRSSTTRTSTRSRRTGTTSRRRRGRRGRSSPRRPRTPTPASASGSSTRPAPARPSPRSASSRPRAPAAS